MPKVLNDNGLLIDVKDSMLRCEEQLLLIARIKRIENVETAALVGNMLVVKTKKQGLTRKQIERLQDRLKVEVANLVADINAAHATVR